MLNKYKNHIYLTESEVIIHFWHGNWNNKIEQVKLFHCVNYLN